MLNSMKLYALCPLSLVDGSHNIAILLHNDIDKKPLPKLLYEIGNQPTNNRTKHKLITKIHRQKPHKFKTTFSVHKLIPIFFQMTTLYTNWSLYITFTMIYYISKNNFVKVSHHYLTSGGYQVSL